jgi:DNA-binding NtrC family response regulator
LSYFAAENGFEEPFLEQDAINILLNYGWPGNVRELRNFCENLVVLKRGSNITQYDLDPRFTLTSNKSAQELDNTSSPTLSVEENEKRLLRNALLQARGNKTKAAELMGISRRTLHRKLVRWPDLDID